MDLLRVRFGTALLRAALVVCSCLGCEEDCVRRCDEEYGECVESGEHPDLCAAKRSACEQSCAERVVEGSAGYQYHVH